MKRSDIIFESGIMEDTECSGFVHNGEKYGTAYTDVNVDEMTGKKHGLKSGRYVTVFTQNGDVTSCLAELIGEMLPEGNALVAGLGNENICSDSLGVKALRHIPATAHLHRHPDFGALDMRRVFVIEAGVTGKTGIESSDRIGCIARHVGADVIVAIDCLACASPERLCTTIQLTNTGIAPGSGVGNDRQVLDRDRTGVPVIAVGVPTVIDLDCITGNDSEKGLMVTPRSIDVTAERLAEVIGSAVSRALNPDMTDRELRSLILL